MRKLDGDFPGGCCVPLGEREGALVCCPDTPETVTGNQWFRFIARLTGTPGEQPIELLWPADNEETKARIEYGNSWNFSTAIHRTIHTSPDTLHWRPVEPVQVEGQAVRFTVNLQSPALYIAVGIPYLPSDLEQLMAEMCASPLAQVQQIATTAHGRPVRAIRIGPQGAGEGSFYLQGMQHASEWAGPRVLSTMARYLVSEAGRPLRERFVWHIVPVMNPDGLQSWREDRQGSNMNRDWRNFATPEAAGARDYVRAILAHGEKLLYMLDMHMGWSTAEASGAGMISSIEGVGDPEVAKRQDRVAEYILAHTNWTNRAWRGKGLRGQTFTNWAVEEMNIPAHTGENSRHLAYERESGQHVRMTQGHEEALGRDLAEALASFGW